MEHLEEGKACQRRERRRDVDLGAIAFQRDGSRSVVAVSNISYEGCQFEGALNLEPAERFRLVLPCLGETNAQARWINGDRVGARFEEGSADELNLQDREALHSARTFNFGSGRMFGRKGVPASDCAR